MLTIEYWTHDNNLEKTTDFSNPQCTIQNYPNCIIIISELGDKLFFCAQFCKHKAIKIMLLKVWRVKNSPM